MLPVLLLACQGALTPKPLPLDSAYLVGWIGDADHDGVNDFAVAGRDHFDETAPNTLTASLVVCSGKTMGELRRVPLCGEACTPNSAHAIADRDGDGLGDVVVCCRITSVYSSRDGRRLANLDRASEFVGRVKSADGHEDLIMNIADQGNYRPVVWRAKDGILDQQRFEQADVWGTSVGDIDGDGSDDIVAKYIHRPSRARVLSGATGQPLVVLDETAFAWLDRQQELLGGDAAVDLDGDGTRDVVLLGVGDAFGGVTAFSGKTGSRLGTWTPPRRGPTGESVSRAISPGDLNGDGHPDLVIAVATVREFKERGPTLVVLSGSTLQTLWTARLGDGAWPGTQALTLPDRDGDGRAEMLFASYGSEYDDGWGSRSLHFGGGWLFATDAHGKTIAKIAP